MIFSKLLRWVSSIAIWLLQTCWSERHKVTLRGVSKSNTAIDCPLLNSVGIVSERRLFSTVHYAGSDLLTSSMRSFSNRANIEPFYFFASPGGSAEKFQAGFDGRVTLEAANIHPRP